MTVSRESNYPPGNGIEILCWNEYTSRVNKFSTSGTRDESSMGFPFSFILSLISCFTDIVVFERLMKGKHLIR